MDATDDPWGNLRKHWEESAKRERENPSADRPPYEFMCEHGNPDMSAAPESGCYAIEPGFTAVSFITSLNDDKWFVHEAGDLWPYKPEKWWPLKSWPVAKGQADG